MIRKEDLYGDTLHRAQQAQLQVRANASLTIDSHIRHKHLKTIIYNIKENYHE